MANSNLSGNSGGDQGGWNQYQKLVISELERLNGRQDNFDKEIVDLKLMQSRVTLEITHLTGDLKDVSDSIKASVEDLKKTKEEIDKQKLSLNTINLKLGMFCFVVSTAAAAAIEMVIKFALH